MERPKNVSELIRRFLGMINHQKKFIENLSVKTRDQRDLLSSKNEWLQGSAQEEAFTRLKIDMIQAPALAHYCTEKETIVSADASSQDQELWSSKFKMTARRNQSLKRLDRQRLQNNPTLIQRKKLLKRRRPTQSSQITFQVKILPRLQAVGAAIGIQMSSRHTSPQPTISHEAS